METIYEKTKTSIMYLPHIKMFGAVVREPARTIYRISLCKEKKLTLKYEASWLCIGSSAYEEEKIKSI